MKDLKIENTSKTPKILLTQKGLIEVKGNSLIENTKSFYIEIIDWLKEYIKTPSEKTVVKFAMDYYNTSSQMWIFQIFNVLSDLEKLDKNIEFNWYYIDIDLKEAGYDIAHLLDIKINLIEDEKEFL